MKSDGKSRQTVIKIIQNCQTMITDFSEKLDLFYVQLIRELNVIETN